MEALLLDAFLAGRVTPLELVAQHLDGLVTDKAREHSVRQLLEDDAPEAIELYSLFARVDAFVPIEDAIFRAGVAAGAEQIRAHLQQQDGGGR